MRLNQYIENNEIVLKSHPTYLLMHMICASIHATFFSLMRLILIEFVYNNNYRLIMTPFFLMRLIINDN